jgi:hypothetical protein
MGFVYAGQLPDDGKFARARATLRRTLPSTVTPKLEKEITDQVRLILG